MKLTGRNVQPWEKFELSIDGLTVIVGNTNKGKSSIFRALRGVVRNELPADWVRNGQNGQEDRMEVSLDIDGFEPIKATRTRKGTTKYLVGKEEFKALGESIPEPMDALKFGKIQVGSTVIDPIFSEQNRAQFLIDPDRWKPADIVSVLGAFSSTEKLDAGKKEAGSRISQRNGEAKTLAEEVREVEERKGRLTKLSEKGDVLVIRVGDLETWVRDCEIRIDLLSEVLEKKGRVAGLRKLASDLYIPDFSEEEVLYRKWGTLFKAAILLGRHSFFLDLKESLDNAASGWDKVLSPYRLGQKLNVLLDMSKDRMTPRRCSEGLNNILGRVESELGFVVRWVSLVKTAETVVPARDKVKERELEADRVRADAEEAVIAEERIRMGLKIGKLVCPKCGTALTCPECRLT